MSTSTETTGYTYTDLLPADFDAEALRQDALAGLTAEGKWLPPKWFYDKNGSELFEEITRLPEYYPTRTERAILLANAAQIITAAACGELIELGSGSSEKTTALLDQLVARGGTAYQALDVSHSALHLACEALVPAYPGLRISAVRADFENQLVDVLGGADGVAETESASRLVIFLGGTIGNLAPVQRARFLSQLRSVLRPGDSFLLGADLVKSPQVLVPAYADAAGVTAAFNLNVLEVLNRRLRADFDRDDFEHLAVWDEQQEWIEMRLRARRAVQVRVADLDLDLSFAAGEQMRTEISAKFTRATLEREFAAAGFGARGWWTDEQDWFSLSLWTPRD
jgi:L-histidine Nalpha-methyltransferase